MTIIAALRTAARALAQLVVREAYAHCDTEDGPAVTDGRRALETGNVNHALKWVLPEHEDEVRQAFRRASQDRRGGGEAQEQADLAFLETLVRVHRAGEGEGFEGIKPAGTALPAEVVAADRALAAGTLEPLRGLMPPERWDGLEERFQLARDRQSFDPDDLVAARAYVQAYVSYVKWAEGEEHEHGHHHTAAHEAAAHHDSSHTVAHHDPRHEPAAPLHGDVHHHGDRRRGEVPLHGDIHHHPDGNTRH